MKPFSTPVLAKRTYRELKLLKHIQHENIISLSDVFISPLEDIYFVTELLGTDLHRLLTSRPLEKQFIQYFLYQILVRFRLLFALIFLFFAAVLGDVLCCNRGLYYRGHCASHHRRVSCGIRGRGPPHASDVGRDDGVLGTSPVVPLSGSCPVEFVDGVDHKCAWRLY